MARIVLPIAGAVVGSFFGNPAAGWAIGSALGAIIDPVEGPDITQQGARLSDLAVTSSTYGGTIPMIWGTSRMAGNIIWSLPLIEEKVVERQETGGKGGGGGSVTTTTYNYFGTFAMGLAEGPASQLIRIWADGKLLYSIYDESDRELENPDEQNLLDIGYEGFTFYTGNETQLPDPLIVADQGDLTPAHRGLCYIVFERLPLNQFGNRIPNITCEVAFNGVDSAGVANFVDDNAGTDRQPLTADWNRGRAYLWRGAESVAVYDFKAGQPTLDSEFTSITSATDADAGIEFNIETFGAPHLTNGAIYAAGDDANNVFGTNRNILMALNPYSLEVDHAIDLGEDIKFWDDSYVHRYTRIVTTSGAVELLYMPGREDTTAGRPWHCPIFSLDTSNAITASALVGIIHGEDLVNWPTPFASETNSTCGYVSTAVVTTNTAINEVYMLAGRVNVTSPATVGDADTEWYVTKLEVNPVLPAVQNESKVLSFTINQLEAAFPDLTWTDDPAVHVLDQLTWDFGDNSTFMFRLITEDTVTTTQQTYYFKWDASIGQWEWGTQDFFLHNDPVSGFSDASTAALDVVSGATIEFDDSTDEIKVWDTRTGVIESTTAITADNQDADYSLYNSQLGLLWNTGNATGGFDYSLMISARANGLDVPVQNIINDITDKVGLDSGALFSVTTAKTVKAYQATQLTSGRNLIQPLLTAFQLDLIESDFGLKVVEKGAASSVNISHDDLIDLGQDSSNYTEQRVEETDLPQKVGITYLDKNLDYQQRTQQAKRILKPTFCMLSYNNIALSLPMVLDPDYAKQLAEITLYSSWEERISYGYRLSQKFLALEPTDVVTVDFPSASFEQRLSETSLGTNFTFDINSLSTNAAQYVSDSYVEDNLGFRPPSLPSADLTRYFLLDTPLLRDSDTVARTADQIYHAGAGYGTGTWPGAVVSKSTDNIVFTGLEQLTTESTWGTITSQLPDTDYPFTPDTATTLQVTLVTGELNSITDNELLNTTANTMAVYKPNGDIEIVQFRDVTPLGGNTYEVSYLLRGRRGTDYAVKDHSSGETFVLLGVSSTVITQVDLVEVGLLRYYKAVSFNQSAPEVISGLSFTSEGNSLKPYAPVEVEAVEDGSSNIDLTWTRRTRVNGSLKDGTGTVPLNEDSEEYEIDIYDAPGTSVVRTVTGLTSPSYEYLNADIISDLGGVPSELNLVVYQISAQVGRGFGVLRTIEVQ